MTEGWHYGTMSVSAQTKGHFCLLGLWEMTPDVLLLILALTACLSEPGHCEDHDGSGAPGTETEITEQLNLTVTHTPVLTGVTLNSTITVHIQQEQFGGGDATYAQVTLEQTSTTKQNLNETHIKAHNITTVKRGSIPRSPLNHTTGDELDYIIECKDPESSEEESGNGMTNVFIIISVCLILTLLLAVGVAVLLITHRKRKKHTHDAEMDDPNMDYDDDDEDEDGEKVPMPMFEDDMPSVMELEMEDFEKWITKGGKI